MRSQKFLLLARRLDGFDTWSLREIHRITYTRQLTNATVRELFALQFLLLFKAVGSVSLDTWHERIAGKITVELSVRRFDHHFTGEDLEGVHVVPPG